MKDRYSKKKAEKTSIILEFGGSAGFVVAPPRLQLLAYVKKSTIIKFTPTFQFLFIPSLDSKKEMASTLLPLATLFLAFSVSYLQIAGAETELLTSLKLNSRILQESITKQINENPEAGWEAAINPRFSNYTVEQFKRILGVKPTPTKELRSTPVKTHPKSLKLPKNFDARTAWSQCSTIGRILVILEDGADFSFLLLTITWVAESLKIRVIVVLVGHLVLLNHCQIAFAFILMLMYLSLLMTFLHAVAFCADLAVMGGIPYLHGGTWSTMVSSLKSVTPILIKLAVLILVVSQHLGLPSVLKSV
ncbi:hypothetical protein VNO77_18204 [Canavalia gladiata]|uniref:Peptidase C1A propeptide domain-containing protein n=1 Tax=Canavalia gladiata TaxID=3824 RepID=A0AAN9LKI2_CANGL